MRIINKLITLTAILCFTLAFNSHANMGNGDPYAPTRSTPETEVKYEDKTLNYEWTWLSDNLCVQYKLSYTANRKRVSLMYESGLLTPYRKDGVDQKRETYSGKWSQDEAGIWSFKFDDDTVPIDITKIDGILYAFNAWGELIEGYTYYPGYKTAADGLVTCDTPEFKEWLATQYIPDCTSNK